MQLVIRVDLDKTERSLPEVFGLIGNCQGHEEVREEAELGATAPIQDGSQRIGEWEIEEEEKGGPRPLDSRYRSAAMSKYVRPGEIEVDRFAPVSAAEDGAYVQAWLFVPESEVGSPTVDAIPARKPPQSISSMRDSERKAG